MNILVYLIPISLFLGGIGLVLFIWTVKNDQYDDPEGDARRILSDEYDDHPKREGTGATRSARDPRIGTRNVTNFRIR